MTNPIRVIARVILNPGREPVFEALAAQLSIITRQEDGCIAYQLHRDLAQPRAYAFIEEWASHSHWEAHMAGAALKAFNAQLPAGSIADIKIHALEPVAGVHVHFSPRSARR